MRLLWKLSLSIIAGAVCAPLVAANLTPTASMRKPDTRDLAPATFQYRAAGEYSRDRYPTEAPLRSIRLAAELIIMEHLVTVAEYAHCVAEAACPRITSSADPVSPMIGVNWHDATGYAAWLSRKTGLHYRLPTDEEWTFAAAEKAADDVPPLIDPVDPAQAWIARYEAESLRATSDIRLFPSANAPSVNSNGLKDVAAGVWEWTDNCFVRAEVDEGREHVTNINCGVRVVEGSHRSYMTDFIRDPKAGGCAVGIPPSALGFRLVVQQPRSLVSQAVRTVSKLLP